MHNISTDYSQQNLLKRDKLLPEEKTYQIYDKILENFDKSNTNQDLTSSFKPEYSDGRLKILKSSRQKYKVSG